MTRSSMVRKANHQIRVVKIGGSLFDTPAIEQLPKWLELQPPMTNLLVVGGGNTVDQIRELQTVEGFSDVEAHWRSITAMQATALKVAKRFRKIGHDVPVLTYTKNTTFAKQDSLTILDVGEFLRCDSEAILPQDWTVTSDSIAAKIAATAQAVELVLLKSTLPPTTATVSSLSSDGIVDEHFPQAFDRPMLRIVNARDNGWPEHAIVTTPKVTLPIAIATDTQSCDQ